MKAFVPLGSRTGLIARPHMNQASLVTVSDEASGCSSGDAASRSGFLGRLGFPVLFTLGRSNPRPGTRSRGHPERCLRSRTYEAGFAGALEEGVPGAVFPGHRAAQFQTGL